MSVFEVPRPDLEAVRARMLLSAGVEWAPEATRDRRWVAGTRVHVPSCPSVEGSEFLFSVVDLAPLSWACELCFPSEWRTWHEEAAAASPCLPALALAEELEAAQDSPPWEVILQGVRRADELLVPTLTGPVPSELSAHLRSEGLRLLSTLELLVPRDAQDVDRAERALELLSLRAEGVLGDDPPRPDSCVLSVLEDRDAPAPLPNPAVRPLRRSPVLLAVESTTDWTGVLTPLVVLTCPVLARLGRRRLLVVPRHVAELRSSRARDRSSWCELPPRPSPEVWDTVLALWAPDRAGDLLADLGAVLEVALALCPGGPR